MNGDIFVNNTFSTTHLLAGLNESSGFVRMNIENIKNTNSNIDQAHSTSPNNSNFKHERKYNTKGDGTCFFRAYLASHSKDESWLMDRSLSEIYLWIHSKESLFLNAIKNAISEIQTRTFTDEISASFLVSLLNANNDDQFGKHLLSEMMNKEEMLLWRDDALREFFKLNFNASLPNHFCSEFIDYIYQSLAEQLNAPMNNMNPVCIKRIGTEMTGYHYVLRAPSDFFEDGSEPGLFPGCSPNFLFSGRDDRPSYEDNIRKYEKYRIETGKYLDIEPLKTKSDLAYYKLKEKNGTLYRCWLLLTTGISDFVYSSDEEIAKELRGEENKFFNNCFSNALAEYLVDESDNELSIHACNEIQREIVLSYFKKGQYDVSEILKELMGKNNNRFTGEKNAKKFKSKNIKYKNVNEVVCKDFESTLIEKLGFPIIEVSDIESSSNKTEYLVKEKDATYSFVALNNDFGCTGKDGLFSKADAIKAGVELLTKILGVTADLASVNGYNIHPYRKVEEFKNADHKIEGSTDHKRNNRDRVNKAGSLDIETSNKRSSVRGLSSHAEPNSPVGRPSRTPCVVQKALHDYVNTILDPKIALSSAPIKVSTEKKIVDEKNWDPLTFPNADARPVPFIEDLKKRDEINDKYHQWHEHKRKKRRAPTNADPNMYMKLDVSSAYGEGTNQAINKIMQIVRDASRSSETRLHDVAEGINTARLKHSSNNRFLQDALDMYLMRVLDTNIDARNAYAFYQQRTKEAVRNDHFYVDTQLENFYSHEDMTYEPPRPMFNDPEASISTRTDYLLAKVLISNHDNVPLSGQDIGLAIGELSVHRQIFQANIETPYLNQLYDVRSRFHDLDSSANVLSPFSKLMSNGSPVTPSGQGACHLVAYSAALEISTTPDASSAVDRIIAKMSGIKESSGVDPAGAHRLLSGLSDMNDQLQPQIRKAIESHKFQIKGVDALVAFIPKMREPNVITLRMNGRNPHVISISPYNSVDYSSTSGQTMRYLVTDSNLGVIDCNSSQMASEISKICVQRYLGTSTRNPDYSALSMSRLPLTESVQSILKLEVTKTSNGQLVGPQAHIRREQTGITDSFGYKHLFSPDAPDMSTFAAVHGTSSSKAWKGLLPEGLAQKTVDGDFGISSDLKRLPEREGDAHLSRQTDSDVERMRALASIENIQCESGACAHDIKKYQETEVVKTRPGPAADVSTNPVRVDAKGEVIYSTIHHKDQPKIADLPPLVEPRQRGPGRTEALELPTRPLKSKSPNVPQRGNRPVAPSPQESRLGYQLEQGMERLRQGGQGEIQHQALRPRGEQGHNVYTRAFDDLPPRIPPRTPPRTAPRAEPPIPVDGASARQRTSALNSPHGTEFIYDRGRLSEMQTTTAGGGALEVATRVDTEMNGDSQQEIKRRGAVRKRTAASSSAPDLGFAPPVPPRDLPSHEGTRGLGRRALDALKGKGKGKGGTDRLLERGGNDDARARPLPSSNFESDTAKILLGVVKAEDPSTTRMMARLMEDVKVQMHRAQAVMASIENMATDAIKSKGLVPRDWVVLSPKTTDKVLTVLYQGSDTSVTKRLETIEISKSFSQAFVEVQNGFNRIYTKLDLSPRMRVFKRKMIDFTKSNGYAGAGKAIGFAGKAMSIFNMYTLVNEARGLENLETHHKVAFAMSASDGVFDALSLAAGGMNKLTKTLGHTFTGLQTSSKILNQVSMGIGLGVTYGLTFVHLYSMTAAQTPLELEIAAANVGFSAASVMLTGMMLAFPPAMPFIALFQFAMMGIQQAVIQAILDKHMRADAKTNLHERWENTEELLKFVSQIGQATVEEVSVTNADGKTTIHIRPKASNAYIEITGNKVKILHRSDAMSISSRVNQFKESTDRGSDGNLHSAHFIYIGPKNTRKAQLWADYTQTNGCVKNKMITALWVRNAFFRGEHFKNIKVTKGDYMMAPKSETSELVNCLLLNDQVTFKEKLKQYLNSETSLDKPPEVIVLSEITPKVEFVSDIGHFHENDYMEKEWTSHPHVKAISNQCQSKAASQNKIKDEICNAVSENVEGINSRDICNTNTAYNWNTKATYFKRPEMPMDCEMNTDEDKKNSEKFMIGPNIVLTNLPKKGRAYYFYNLEYGHLPVRKQAVSTIPTSVRLTQPVSKMKIDITKKEGEDSLAFVILPEKISTGLMTKTLPHYFFDYGTKEKQNEVRSLKVHSDSYANVKSLSTYDIDLVANQNNAFILAAGTKTAIHEKDNHSGMREGGYLLTLISPNSQEKQKEKIRALKEEKNTREKTFKKEAKGLPNKEKQYTDAVQLLQSLKDSAASGFGTDDNSEREAAAQVNVGYTKKDFLESKGKVAVNENRVEELNLLIPEEEKISYVPIEQLKTKIEYDVNTKTLKLNVNHAERQEYNRINFEITDLQRNVTLIHNEPVSVDGKQIEMGCIFDLQIESDTSHLKLTQLTGLSPSAISKVNEKKYLQKLKEQLEINNPQLDVSLMSSNYISILKFSKDDQKFVGVTSGAQKEVSLIQGNDPEAFTGHAMLFNFNRAENQSNAVCVIYPKESSQEEIDMYQRLTYLGEEKIASKEEVPEEYHALYDSTPEALKKVYYFFDERTRYLVKQVMNSAIRKEDVSICEANETPRKFTGKIGASPIYKCNANNILDLSETVDACKTTQQGECGDLFGYIERKQKEEGLPQILTILNPGLITDQNTNNTELNPEKTPIWMEYISGENPALMLIEKQKDNKAVGVFTRNIENNYVIFAEEIETESNENKKRLNTLNEQRKTKNLKPMTEIRISSAPLLNGAELTDAGNILAGSDVSENGIPSSLLQETKNIAENMNIVSMIKNPKGGYILETLEGVAFSISEDLQEKHLVATSKNYFTNNNITSTSTEDIKAAYEELEVQYGIPEFTYMKMSGGEVTQEGEVQKPMIFMDSLLKQPLFVPRNNQTSPTSYILGSLENESQPFLLTVHNPETLSIDTVTEPTNPTNTTQATSLNYSFFNVNKGSMSLSLRPSDTFTRTDQNSEVQLPYLPTESLYLFPEIPNMLGNHTTLEPGNHTILEIGDLMSEQLKMITLVPPEDPETEEEKKGVVQSISIKKNEHLQNKAFIEEVSYQESSVGNETQRMKTMKRLMIAVPKMFLNYDQTDGIRFSAINTDELSSKYTLIHLYDAFDLAGNLKKEFDNKIVINGQALNGAQLTELVNSATILSDAK